MRRLRRQRHRRLRRLDLRRPARPHILSRLGGITQGNSCVPKSCSDQGFNCGLNGDTCGGQIDCQACTGDQKCGYGGFSKCGSQFTTADGGVLCTPKTCADLGYDCGPAGDGCGNMIDCSADGGPCPGNQFCGGGGPSKCGGDFTTTPDGGPVCVPKTCADLGYDCGSAGDGCGGTIGPCGPTGTCTSPQFCGGGGPNKCGGDNGHTPDGGSTVTCVPKTCADLGATCGILGDGCGGTTPSCGTCQSPQFCGGGGPSQCGGDNGRGTDGGLACTPQTCASYGAGTCGQQSDGCGGLTANCGTCNNPQFCGGGGPGMCGGNNTVGADGGASQCKPDDVREPRLQLRPGRATGAAESSARAAPMRRAAVVRRRRQAQRLRQHPARAPASARSRPRAPAASRPR